MFIVSRGREEAFIGDLLMMAIFVASLNDSGIPAVMRVSREDVKELIDVPLWNGEQGEEYTWRYEELPPVGSFVERTLKHFGETTGLNATLTRRGVPVKMHDEETPVVDVALGTKTSNWTPYRMWPYFAELKKMLSENNVTWIDMDEESIVGNKCLNVVKKCQLYVGLETGRSHLVSSIAAGKTLILQSGYCESSYWSVYDFDFLSLKVDCAPCFLRRNCKYGHKCMADLGPEVVLGKILTRLNTK